MTNSKNYLYIDKIVAFVSVDKDGHEGVLGMNTPDGWMPLIGADEVKVKQLYPIAVQISEIYGMKFRVLEFTTRNDITEQVKQLHEAPPTDTGADVASKN
jgi:hypothetical protein